MDRSALVSAAAAICEQIRSRAVHLPDGAVVWHAPDPAGGKAMGPHLYGGATGVALFLAAYDHVRGSDEHQAIVTGALAPLRRKLCQVVRDPDRSAQLRVPLGGLEGLGGWIYALVRIGEWTGAARMTAEAHDLTLLFTPERIRADERLDVIGGCAGAVLALLALDRAAPGPNARGETPLEVAAACASHLLARRTGDPGGPRAWPDLAGRRLGGFAHGASGTACALLRLFARTGAPELREAAVEGIAYERSLFDPRADNWLDPRFGRLLEHNAWCHGAPGIALGRLGALDVHDDPEVRRELAGALLRTRRFPDTPVDDLCCGNSGRAEVLLCAHQALGDESLLGDAMALALRVVRRASACGGYGLVPSGAPGSEPSLFRGVAGIGYTLLRLASPDALPCILRLE